MKTKYLTESEAWQFIAGEFEKRAKGEDYNYVACGRLCRAVLQLSFWSKITSKTAQSMNKKIEGHWKSKRTPRPATGRTVLFWTYSNQGALKCAILARKFAKISL